MAFGFALPADAGERTCVFLFPRMWVRKHSSSLPVYAGEESVAGWRHSFLPADVGESETFWCCHTYFIVYENWISPHSRRTEL